MTLWPQEIEQYPARLRLLKDKLAGIVAAAIFRGLISVQEGLLDAIDSVLNQQDDNDTPAAEDNYGHHPMQWPRLIAQRLLDPSIVGACSPAASNQATAIFLMSGLSQEAWEVFDPSP